MSHTYSGQSAPLGRRIGEHSAKLQNDLTPELRDKEKREWKGSELMSEEQARRLHEVGLKRAKKLSARQGTGQGTGQGRQTP